MHRCFAPVRAFEAAAANFRRVSGGDGSGMLWLVETAGEGAAERLQEVTGEWLRRDLDDVTCLFERGETRITIVQGRQWVGREGLELLVVGTRARETGQPLRAMIDRWIEEDVLLMLPWGFGKWTGRRAGVVASLFEEYAHRGLRLADTGLRTRWQPLPDLFGNSLEAGYPVFAGSDPFPFPARVDAIGGHGFQFPGDPPGRWKELCATLRSATPGDIERFGRPLSVARFIALQSRIQLRKRLGGRP